MSVKFFLPKSSANSDLETVLQVALSCRPMVPFDGVLVDFVTDFAKSILLDKDSRAYPELIVLANFFKAANIVKLRT